MSGMLMKVDDAPFALKWYFSIVISYTLILTRTHISLNFNLKTNSKAATAIFNNNKKATNEKIYIFKR